MNENVPESAPKKKKHTGYAFIVFEREKDMKGKAPHTYRLCSTSVCHQLAVQSELGGPLMPDNVDPSPIHKVNIQGIETNTSLLVF
jgi:hypothetical protein